ncbi:MAG: hypothetical protein F6K28_02075 [Microcoleus sp. SIO2G3]|nr:hypothetical protein [Microcoleus sp. SIO2G3]
MPKCVATRSSSECDRLGDRTLREHQNPFGEQLVVWQVNFAGYKDSPRLPVSASPRPSKPVNFALVEY